MTPPLTVVAQMKARAGREEALRLALVGLLKTTRAEKGCLNYDLHESLETPGLFLFYENWASRKDLDRHLAAPHIISLMARSAELLAAPVEINFWEKRDV